jgi:hypothetical protein
VSCRGRADFPGQQQITDLRQTRQAGEAKQLLRAHAHFFDFIRRARGGTGVDLRRQAYRTAAIGAERNLGVASRYRRRRPG